MDKRRAWRGLLITVFMSMNSDYFYHHLFYSDKETWHFAFLGTQTPYYLVDKPHMGVGRAVKDVQGKWRFCSGAMGQRHPESGIILFLHRSGNAKFKQLGEYLSMKPIPRSWTHVAEQPTLHEVFMQLT